MFVCECERERNVREIYLHSNISQGGEEKEQEETGRSESDVIPAPRGHLLKHLKSHRRSVDVIRC